MRPFDLEAVKRGARVCTRSGKPVQLFKFNGESDHCGVPQPLEGWINGNKIATYRFGVDGSYMHYEESSLDLFMAADVATDAKAEKLSDMWPKELWWQEEARRISDQQAGIVEAHVEIRKMLGL